jgi:hypothetical protein
MILLRNTEPTFIDKDNVDSGIKWRADDVETFAELAVATAVTAQHVLRYRFWLTQQRRGRVLKRQPVHLGQANGGLPVVCK